MTTTEARVGEHTEQSVETVFAMAAELNDPSSEWYQRFYDQERGVTPTPVWQMPKRVNGHTLFIKDETSHVVTLNGRQFDVGAFKRRGSWAAAVAPSAEGEDEPDVYVTASAGNHAQGVAVAAALLRKGAELYCKKSISSVKRQKNEDIGADIFSRSDSLEDAMLEAELAEGRGPDGLVRRNIKPFDQAEVIAGQSTMVSEWLASLEASQAAGELDLHNDEVTVVVPVGGGGLISGWAAGLELAKQQGRIGSNVRLVGAQMERCDAMTRALNAGEAYDGLPTLRQDQLNDMNDGTAVLKPGSLTFEITRQYADEMVILTPEEVGLAMRELSAVLGKDVEPAGALAYAAAQKLMSKPHAGPGRSLVTCVASGANVSEETKTYFSDQVEIAAARRRFAAMSAEHLRSNPEYKRLMSRAVRTAGVEYRGSQVASAPTHSERTGLVMPQSR